MTSGRRSHRLERGNAETKFPACSLRQKADFVWLRHGRERSFTRNNHDLGNLVDALKGLESSHDCVARYHPLHRKRPV